MPREILRSRMIREKKPWVLAAASLLLGGFALNYALHSSRANEVSEARYSQHLPQVQSVSSRSSTFTSTDQQNIDQYEKLKLVGEQVVGNSERRFQMLELLTAIDAALPREEGLAPGQVSSRPLEAVDEHQQREELYIETMESKFYGGEDNPISGDDGWFNEAAKGRYAQTLAMLANPTPGASGGTQTTPPATESDTPADATTEGEALEEDATTEEDADVEAAAAEIADIEGSGWVIELSGYHFHNKKYPMAGSEYVRQTLVKNLMTGSVVLPTPGGPNETEEFAMSELGISHAIIAEDGKITTMKILNPDWAPPSFDDEEDMMMMDPLAAITGKKKKKDDKPEVPQYLKPRTHRFKVHFLWRPTRLSERLEARQLAAEGITDNQIEGEN